MPYSKDTYSHPGYLSKGRPGAREPWILLTYEGIRDYIAGGRSKVDRPVENNTRAVVGITESGEKYAAMRLHRTEVIRWYENGDIELNSGGWRTVTTKSRMAYLRQFSVSSRKGIWHVTTPTGKTHRFFDGMRFTKRGRLTNPQGTEAKNRKKDRAHEQRRKEIRAYSKWAARDLAERPREATTAGDCWYCSMITTDGQTLGDASSHEDHLLAHIEEKYAPNSLIWNALTEAGYRYPGAIAGAREQDDGPAMIGGRYAHAEMIERAIYRYLTARLLPDHAGAKPMRKEVAR